MKKQYIKLPDISNQKMRKKYYIASAVKHPAKADIPMMVWILKKFCKDGDIVLDPMAGIGGTLIEGMRLFPNSIFIGIELEEKFVKWCNASIKKTEKIAKEDWFMKVGKAICIQGDARELGKVVKEKVSKIISSPPYAETVSPFARGTALSKDKGTKIGCHNIGEGYSENKNNIGNLKHGEIDKIITSPPYAEQVQSSRHSDHQPGRRKERLAEAGYDPEKYWSGKCDVTWEYGKDKENIGNLKQQTYLEAMYLVYCQCFKVLKPEGLMILITKDFIRSQKRIRLGEDTIKLCQMARFKHIHTYHRKIENPSFWRILYEQKYPQVEKIDCEDIIEFRKDNED